MTSSAGFSKRIVTSDTRPPADLCADLKRLKRDLDLQRGMQSLAAAKMRQAPENVNGRRSFAALRRKNRKEWPPNSQIISNFTEAKVAITSVGLLLFVVAVAILVHLP